MIDINSQLRLPKPWTDQLFQIDRLGELTFLVGPNGSGKSRFASTLRNILPNSRMLGTDRLEGMSRSALVDFIGDPFQSGYQKNSFAHIRNAGGAGSGIDAFIILEERPDIRVIVEATLVRYSNATSQLNGIPEI
jgi:energy-coupling factor transporter ATP-binding protein EcfA2